MSKKTKTFFDPQRNPYFPPPHKTPKNDRKVHSLNNAVVFVLLPKANPTKGLYFEFRSDNPSPTSHC